MLMEVKFQVALNLAPIGSYYYLQYHLLHFFGFNFVHGHQSFAHWRLDKRPIVQFKSTTMDLAMTTYSKSTTYWLTWTFVCKWGEHKAHEHQMYWYDGNWMLSKLLDHNIPDALKMMLCRFLLTDLKLILCISLDWDLNWSIHKMWYTLTNIYSMIKTWVLCVLINFSQLSSDSIMKETLTWGDCKLMEELCNLWIGGRQWLVSEVGRKSFKMEVLNSQIQ